MVFLREHRFGCGQRRDFAIVEHDGFGFAAGIDKHEAAAADIAGAGPRHLHRQRGRHGGVHGVTALFEDVAADFRSEG